MSASLTDLTTEVASINARCSLINLDTGGAFGSNALAIGAAAWALHAAGDPNPLRVVSNAEAKEALAHDIKRHGADIRTGLVRAAALLALEIERIDRAALNQETT